MSKHAFTLVELLVILAIIGILSSFIFVQTNNAINSGKDSKRKSDVALLASGIHVYSIGSELIASSGCNIGSTCSTEINDSLTAQLGPLPTDPDTNKSYIYQSDGTDCTISAILSDGQTYQYDCSQDTMSQSSPIDGQCGSAANQGSYTIPTSNFCSDGYVPTVSGTGPWTWSCPGQYLGSPASCTAYKSVDGVCGTKNGKYSSSAPVGQEACYAGTALNMTGSYSWTCDGLNGGLDSETCSTVAASYTVIQFTTVGTTLWDVPAGVVSIDYLVVGGGGNGGYGSSEGSGGGGAGGYYTGSGLAVSDTETIIVGGATLPSSLTNDGETIVAPAGVSANNTVSGASGNGYAGGTYSGYAGGGGGGVTAAGGNATTIRAGIGGAGTTVTIGGTSISFGGGGGGGSYGEYPNVGGFGGGGNGGGPVSSPTNGQPNTGGGGGGGNGGVSGNFGAGGSGIVVIGYIDNY